MDFEYSPKVKDLQSRISAFMAEHVYPNEARWHEEVTANRRAGNVWVPTRIVEELKREAKAQGLWNLWLPESEYGAGLANLEYAPLAEVMGREELVAAGFMHAATGKTRPAMRTAPPGARTALTAERNPPCSARWLPVSSWCMPPYRHLSFRVIAAQLPRDQPCSSCLLIREIMLSRSTPSPRLPAAISLHSRISQCW